MTLSSIRNLRLPINQLRTPRFPAPTLSMSWTNRPRLSSPPSWMVRKPPEQVQIFIPGSKDKVFLRRNYTLPELARTKRQFLVFAKQKSCHDVTKLSTMFVQYINANLTE